MSKNGIFPLEMANEDKRSPELVQALITTLPREDLVVDMGCRRGYYLAELAKEGFRGLGIEGTPGIQAVADFSPIITADLSKPLSLDLPDKSCSVLSIEVGEHIAREFEAVFLDNLVCYAKRLTISWAHHEQGGFGHVNERWADWVQKEIEQRGMTLDDYATRSISKAVEGAECWWLESNLLAFKRSY